VSALVEDNACGYRIHARVVRQRQSGEIHASMVCLGEYIVWRIDGEVEPGATEFVEEIWVRRPLAFYFA
jgi:hypothetical protein